MTIRQWHACITLTQNGHTEAGPKSKTQVFPPCPCLPHLSCMFVPCHLLYTVSSVNTLIRYIQPQTNLWSPRSILLRVTVKTLHHIPGCWHDPKKEKKNRIVKLCIKNCLQVYHFPNPFHKAYMKKKPIFFPWSVSTSPITQSGPCLWYCLTELYSVAKN